MTMNPSRPPDFNQIADSEVKRAFLGRGPECVLLLPPGTDLYKWSRSITGKSGISPWWLFLESRMLPNGARSDGLRERQEYAERLAVNDRDYHRVRAGVTKQWNPMTNPVAIRLNHQAWGYVGKAAGQLQDDSIPDVYWIAGDYQVWIPGLKAADVSQITISKNISDRAGIMLWLRGWELCRQLDCLDHTPESALKDRVAALQWLQQFKEDTSKMLAMRTLILQEHSAWQIAGMSDEVVIDQIVEMLISDHAHVHAEPEQAVSSRGPGASEPAKVVPFPLSERKVREQPDSKPVSDPPTFSSDLDGAAQADALTAAAADGKPFCPE